MKVYTHDDHGREEERFISLGDYYRFNVRGYDRQVKVLSIDKKKGVKVLDVDANRIETYEPNSDKKTFLPFIKNLIRS